MQPYNKDTPCVKCGEIGAFSKYCPSQRFVYHDGSVTFPEFMKRICGICGFEWRESTLDACKIAEDQVKNEPQPLG